MPWTVAAVLGVSEQPGRSIGLSLAEHIAAQGALLRLVALAQSNRQIAAELVLSEKTVERHLGHIFTKLQVSSRAAAVRMAVQAGIA